jgi:hypothetical protein
MAATVAEQIDTKTAYRIIRKLWEGRDPVTKPPLPGNWLACETCHQVQEETFSMNHDFSLGELGLLFNRYYVIQQKSSSACALMDSRLWRRLYLVFTTEEFTNNAPVTISRPLDILLQQYNDRRYLWSGNQHPTHPIKYSFSLRLRPFGDQTRLSIYTKARTHRSNVTLFSFTVKSTRKHLLPSKVVKILFQNPKFFCFNTFNIGKYIRLL